MPRTACARWPPWNSPRSARTPARPLEASNSQLSERARARALHTRACCHARVKLCDRNCGGRLANVVAVLRARACV
eukprot:11201378-Lingulodinium_polyedra.AAC.1